MIGEILTTGDEIRCGALIDSNSAHIAQALLDAGVDVDRHQSVGDDLASIVTILNVLTCTGSSVSYFFMARNTLK